MKTKKLASGFEIPVLGFGTFGIGGDFERNATNDEKYMQAIQNAIDSGLTHIDTAEIYGANHTEDLIGQATVEYDRTKLFIASKVSVEHLRYEDVLEAAKKSLSRLKTEYLDLYLIHGWNPEIPIEETMKAMNTLVDERRVRYIGVCNFTIKQLKEAQKHSETKIVMNQMKYCLWTKNLPDLETMRFCQDNDIMITTYKLFGRGKLEQDRIPLITQIAKKYQKTEAQVITNWIVSKKNTVAIFKSMNKKAYRREHSSVGIRHGF